MQQFTRYNAAFQRHLALKTRQTTLFWPDFHTTEINLGIVGRAIYLGLTSCVAMGYGL
jgi:hypothetical protein